MASPLGNFDQSMKLLVVGVGFNLKFYFNFRDMPFFVGPRMNRRPSKLDFAHARSDSERHQQTSAQCAEERRHRIGRGGIFSRQPPSQLAVLHLGVERIAHRIDDDVAMARRFLRWICCRHVRSVVLQRPTLAETATFLQTVRSGSWTRSPGFSISSRQSIIVDCNRGAL
jgi:hypothetical protein